MCSLYASPVFPYDSPVFPYDSLCSPVTALFPPPMTALCSPYDSPVCSPIPGLCSREHSSPCYSGMCLPRRAVCDRLVNCPGKSYEDEVHCAHTPAQTCGDLLLMGYPSGAYDVRPLYLGMDSSALLM